MLQPSYRLLCPVVLLVSLACSKDSTAPNDPPLLGTYVLESVGGNTLPWLAVDQADIRLFYLADTLRILSESTAEGVYVSRRHTAGDAVGTVSTRRQSATFNRVTPTSLVFNGSVPGDTVFLTATGLREHSPPFQACVANPCVWVWRRL